MKAAGLKAIDTVVSSTAILIKSKNPSNPQLVDLIASRIRGVISEYFHPPCDIFLLLTVSSCSKIRSVPIQRPTNESGGSFENNTRKTSTNYQRFGRRRLGRSQFYGREEENRDSYGRFDRSWSCGHPGVGYCEHENRLITGVKYPHRRCFDYWSGWIQKRRLLVATWVRSVSLSL